MPPPASIAPATDTLGAGRQCVAAARWQADPHADPSRARAPGSRPRPADRCTASNPWPSCCMREHSAPWRRSSAPTPPRLHGRSTAHAPMTPPRQRRVRHHRRHRPSRFPSAMPGRTACADGLRCPTPRPHDCRRAVGRRADAAPGWRGDVPAFEQLYARHRCRCTASCCASCAISALADELFQDVWQRVIAARGGWTPEAAFSAWLYRIAHNRLADHWRGAASTARPRRRTPTSAPRASPTPTRPSANLSRIRAAPPPAAGARGPAARSNARWCCCGWNRNSPGGDRRDHRRRPRNGEIAAALRDGQAAREAATNERRCPHPPTRPAVARRARTGGRLSRLGPHDDPSAALDARILAAAHAAATAPARTRRGGGRRWAAVPASLMTGAGLAASLVVVLGVVWQLRPIAPASRRRGQEAPLADGGFVPAQPLPSRQPARIAPPPAGRGGLRHGQRRPAPTRHAAPRRIHRLARTGARRSTGSHRRPAPAAPAMAPDSPPAATALADRAADMSGAAAATADRYRRRYPSHPNAAAATPPRPGPPAEAMAQRPGHPRSEAARVGARPAPARIVRCPTGSRRPGAGRPTPGCMTHPRAAATPATWPTRASLQQFQRAHPTARARTTCATCCRHHDRATRWPHAPRHTHRGQAQPLRRACRAGGLRPTPRWRSSPRSATRPPPTTAGPTASASEYRSNDDGEPGGTAGRPILAAIDGQGFDRVAVVVTRWYGGIKLGAGGLVRAYGGAAAECLRAAPRRPLVVAVRTAR